MPFSFKADFFFDEPFMHSHFPHSTKICMPAGSLVCFVAFLLAHVAATSALAADEPLRYQWPEKEGREYAVEVRSLTDNTWLIQNFILNVRTKSIADNLATLHVGMSSPRSTSEPVAANQRTSRILQGFPQLLALRLATTREQQPSSVVVDVDGRSAIRETEELPYLLGHASELLFDHLPEADQKEWTHQRTGSLLAVSSRDPNSASLPFTVESKYRVSDVSENHATMTREFRLFTDELRNGEAHVELQATKSSRFDRQSGAVTNVTLEGRLSIRDDRIQVHYPVRLEAHLLSAEEKVKMIADAKKARADAAASAALREAEARKEFTSEERAKILKQLELGESDALDVLHRRRPAKPDAEISAALVRLANTDNQSRREAVFAALEWWGDTNSIPLLIEGMKNTKDYLVPQRARAAIVRLRAKEGVPILINQLRGKRTQAYYAVQALSEMGPIVEESVLPLLADEDEDVQQDAIKILGSAGTSKSLIELTKLAQTADVTQGYHLKKAIAQIEARVKETK
jgi:hypothetical protein